MQDNDVDELIFELVQGIDNTSISDLSSQPLSVMADDKENINESFPVVSADRDDDCFNFEEHEMMMREDMAALDM